MRKLPAIVARRREVAEHIRRGLQELPTVSMPEPLPGAEPSYWFLRLRFDAESARCSKEEFCAALSAEGLPLAVNYRGAMPHTMDWFRNRRVFGESGYPWTAPEYQGDRNADFPCPNANRTMDEQFNVYAHEGWGEREVEDALAIFRKVDAAFRK